MSCIYCKYSVIFSLKLDCGVKVHFECLAKILASNSEREYTCPNCNKPISKLTPYWDILREHGMNETEIFYMKLSKNTVMNGLARYLIETEGAPLEQVLTRAYLVYKNTDALFPDSRETYKYALMTGDRRIVKLLKRIYGINRIHIKLSNSLFDEAWDKDWLELINDLYERGVTPEIYEEDKDPIMLAAKTGDYELMDRLVTDGADLTHSHENGTPLGQACISYEFKSTEEKIRFIDKYWGDIMGEDIKKFYDYYERTCPFKNAIKMNDIDLVKYLVKKGVKTSYDALEFAINYENVNVEMVKIVDEGCERHLYMIHLEQACRKRSFDLIVYILNSDKFFEFFKTRMLHELIQQNHLTLVKIFLECNVLPDKTMVEEVVQNGHFHMIKLFIDYGVMPTNIENLFLKFNFEAIRVFNQNTIAEILEYFVYIGANIDASDYNGYTALSRLCKHESNLPIIEVFVQLGANIQADTKRENYIEACPLLVAAGNGCPNILRFLIKNGADPYVVDSRHRTCYDCALFQSLHKETIKFTLPFFDEAYIDISHESFELLKGNGLNIDN